MVGSSRRRCRADSHFCSGGCRRALAWSAIIQLDPDTLTARWWTAKEKAEEEEEEEEEEERDDDEEEMRR